MRKLLAALPILFLLMCARPAHAQMFVQAQTTLCAGFGSGTCAFPGNTTSGNMGVAIIDCATLCSPTIMDSQGKTWTNVATCAIVSGTSTANIYEADGLNSAADTLTIGTGSQNWHGYLGEYSGMSAPAFDKTACATGSGTAINSGNTATLSQANELVIGYIFGDGSQVAGSGFNTRVNQNPGGDRLYEDKNVTSTAAVAATGTQNFDNWGAMVATFKAGGSPPAVKRLRGSVVSR